MTLSLRFWISSFRRFNATRQCVRNILVERKERLMISSVSCDTSGNRGRKCILLNSRLVFKDVEKVKRLKILDKVLGLRINFRILKWINLFLFLFLHHQLKTFKRCLLHPTFLHSRPPILPLKHQFFLSSIRWIAGSVLPYQHIPVRGCQLIFWRIFSY